jgi:hypothetical protein
MWKIGNIIGGSGGSEEPPEVAGNFSGICLVAACGRCVWEDMARFKEISNDIRADIMAVNLMGLIYPGRIQHWVSIHHEIFAGLEALRSFRLGRHGHVWTHSLKTGPGVQFAWGIEKMGGTSTLYAALVALCLGYTKVILAGAPLNNDGHFYDPPGEVTAFNSRPIKLEWESARQEMFQDRVRSMSGWTKKTLGEPTKEWINGLSSRNL